MTTPRYQWQPTTAEIAAAAGIPPSQVVRFDHNTSPYPSEWAVPLAAAVAGHLNEYPGASYRPLRAAAAASAGVEPGWVVPGAGIDELILLAAAAFLHAGDTALGFEPTYPLYRIATTGRGAHWRSAPFLGPGFESTFPEPATSMRGTRLVWLCTPNNPTGRRMPDSLVAAVLADAPGIVVVDAAYAEYAGDRWADWVHRHENLIVLHTLSKAYGLAGLRVGYAIAHPDLIDALDGVRPPGSLSSLAAAIGEAALASVDPSVTVELIEAEKARLSSRLGTVGFRVVPSQTNFLLCEVGDHALDLEAALRRRGLVVRSFRRGPLTRYLRFTVRSASENDRLVEALYARPGRDGGATPLVQG